MSRVPVGCKAVWRGKDMSTIDETPPSETGITIRYRIVLLAGFAFSLYLLTSDINVDELDYGNQVWGRPQQLLRDPASRWREGLPLVGWYFLAGLSLAGPFQTRTQSKAARRSLFSGRSLRLAIGVLAWLQ